MRKGPVEAVAQKSRTAEQLFADTNWWVTMEERGDSLYFHKDYNQCGKIIRKEEKEFDLLGPKTLQYKFHLCYFIWCSSLFFPSPAYASPVSPLWFCDSKEVIVLTQTIINPSCLFIASGRVMWSWLLATALFIPVFLAQSGCQTPDVAFCLPSLLGLHVMPRRVPSRAGLLAAGACAATCLLL